MKVILLCDHKWRDLPPLAAIKLYLERLGFRVWIFAVRDAIGMIPVIRPDCVVLNHFWGNQYQQLAVRMREAGTTMVVLPTEGAGRPIFHEVDRGDVTDFSLIDRLYSWGPRNSQAMLARGAVPPDRLVTSGCPRTDFYRQPLMGAVTPRSEFAAEHGLDPAQPIVTWATQFPHAAISRDDPREWDLYCRSMTDFGLDRCFTSVGVDFRVMPEYHRNLRDASADLFFAYARANPGLQFILKPHPNEKREFYEARIRDAGVANVRFCRVDYMWNVLHAADVLLHRHCTTAVEAWLWKKPTIEFATIPDEFMAWPEREAGSHVARDFGELDALVRDFLAGRTIEPEREAIREAYIRDWFGEPDGRRCLSIAEDIAALVRSRRPSRPPRRSFAAAGVRPSDTARSIARHALALPPSASLKREGLRALTGRHASSAESRLRKEVTRIDVKAYVDRLRPLVGSRAT
jgi:surface carbohydrate biosynthesis protein